MDKTYGIDWIDFLNKNQTVQIRNEEEFDKFIKFFQKHGIVDVLLKNNLKDYDSWQILSQLNGHNPKLIIFEYDNARGLTFGYTIESATDWYGKPPLTVDDLDI